MNRIPLRYDYGLMHSEKVGKLLLSMKSENPQNVAELLQASLPAAQVALLKAIAKQAAAQSAAIYLVGGPVRDLLLGVPLKDIDLVVEGRALNLALDLKTSYGGQITQHKRFGTAKWNLAETKQALTDKLGPDLRAGDLPDSIDLISAREESYAEPGSLPKVEFAEIEQDTKRRDFTLNTLALRLDGDHFGELIDLWSGLDDLRAGQLRVLREKSFVDDPTRILRIQRFAARFGFQIEDKTLALLKAGMDGILQISGERIRNELDLVLSEATRNAALYQMQQLGILQVIHPELHFDAQMAAALEKHPESLPDTDWELDNVPRLHLAYVFWLGMLSSQAASAVAERLRLESGLSQAIREASQFRPTLGSLADAKPSEAVILLEKLPALARYALYLDADDEGIREILLSYAQSWRLMMPKTTGGELLRRGLKEGPRFKEILARLRAGWLDGEIVSGEDEEKLLEQLLNESAK